MNNQIIVIAFVGHDDTIVCHGEKTWGDYIQYQCSLKNFCAETHRYFVDIHYPEVAYILTDYETILQELANNPNDPFCQEIAQKAGRVVNDYL